MTCPSCGALGAPADATCRACGASLASEEEITVVLKPRANRAPAMQSAPLPAAPLPTAPTLPAIAQAAPPLVVDLGTIVQAPAPVPVPTAPAPAWAPPVPQAPEPWRPAGMPAGPPFGPPPELPPGPGGAARRRWPLFVGIALVAAILAALLAFLLLRGDSDQRTAGSILQGAQSRVTDVGGRLNNATKSVTLRQVGATASAGAQELDSASQTVAEIKDEALQQRTSAVLDADKRYLQALAGLKGLDQRALLAPDQPVWAKIRRTSDATVAEISQRTGALADDKLPGNIAVDTKALLAASDAADSTIQSASVSLRRWKADLAKYNERKRQAEVRAAKVVAYRQQVRDILETYAKDRRKVDPTVAHINALSYERAYSDIKRFEVDRDSVNSSLGLVLPPSGVSDRVQEAQAGLSEPVNSSLEALSYAESAIQEAASDEVNVDEEQDWELFRSKSKEVDSQLTAATQSWEAAVEAARQSELNRGVGARPKYPNV